MFRTVENSYRITARCTDDEHEGTYTFEVGPDADWEDVATQMFYDEFGTNPTCISFESKEII